MSSYPVFTRSAVAIAIASLTLSVVAQESAAPTSPEQITGPADPIVVTATRIPTRYNLLIPDVSVIDRETMQEYGAQAPITDVLANEPGITVNTYGTMGAAADVKVRGATNNQSILLVDGIRLGSTMNGGATWAYLPMQQIGRMEIVRGPTSSSYGSDAIGGVIQIFTRKGEGPTKYYADAGYGTYGTSAETVGVEGSRDGFSYSLYGGNIHSLGLPTLTNGSPGFDPNSAAYVNSSASTRLAYTFMSGQEIGASILYGNGYNSYTDYYSMARNNQLTTVASVYTKNQVIDEWQSLIRAGQSVDNQRNYYANGNPYYYYRSTQNQIQWQNDLKLPVGKGMLAYEFLQQKLGSDSLTAPSGDSPNVISFASRNINSVQGGWNGDVGNHLFQANIRNDNNTQFGNAVTGSVGYGYFVLPTVRATATWGTGFRAPDFQELYVSLPGWGSYGNPNLQPEKSQDSEVALRYDNGIHRAGLIYYYNNVTNLIQYTGANYVSSAPTYENVGRAVLQGLTASYGGKVFGLDTSASYDYQDTRNMNTGGWLPYNPANFGSMTISKKNERWDFGGQMQVSGSQFSPGTDSNLTLGGYTLFNIFGSLKLIKDVSLFMRGNNIFDRQYSTRGFPASSANSSPTYYRTPGSNFFVGLRFDTR